MGHTFCDPCPWCHRHHGHSPECLMDFRDTRMEQMARKGYRDAVREDTAARATRMEQMIRVGYTGPEHDHDA